MVHTSSREGFESATTNRLEISGLCKSETSATLSTWFGWPHHKPNYLPVPMQLIFFNIYTHCYGTTIWDGLTTCDVIETRHHELSIIYEIATDFERASYRRRYDVMYESKSLKRIVLTKYVLNTTTNTIDPRTTGGNLGNLFQNILVRLEHIINIWNHNILFEFIK